MVIVPKAQMRKHQISQDSCHTATTRFFLAAMDNMVQEHKLR